ncbi:MAG TPA: CopD family protein [Polyangiaceae bacterium]
MLPLATGLVAAHVLANVVWIGSLLAECLLIGRARFMADGAEVGGLARRVHMRLAAPAFVASFAFGVSRIALEPRLYLHLPWMHVKLAFAAGVIVLHHVIGARARRVAKGALTEGSGGPFIGAVVFLCAAVAVLLGVAKQLP